MRSRSRSGLAVCCALLALLPAAPAARGADAQSVGPATFTPPEGWSVKSQGEGVVRVSSPDDSAAILVMPAPPMEGDLREEFDASWVLLRKGLKVQKVLKRGEVESRVNGKGYETVRTEATVQDANGNVVACRYVLVRKGTAACGVLFAGAPEAFERFSGEWAKFSAGFSLGGNKPGAGDKSAPAARGRGAPDEGAPDEGDPADGAPAAKARPAPEPPKVRPGMIAGRIADVRGNIIEDARLVVTVSGTTLAGQRSAFDIEVGEDGLFAQEVPDGLWRIYGFIEKEYDGHKYRLPLDPEDKRQIGSSQGTRDGVVKNFVWRVAGLKPKEDKSLPGSYYGGAFEVMDGRGLNEQTRLVARHPGTKLVISLQPRGPLLDGTRGRPVNVEAEVAAVDGFIRPTFFDIPLGEYVATARLVAPNGASAPVNVAMGIVIPEGGGVRPSPAARMTFLPQSAVESLKTVTVTVWE